MRDDQQLEATLKGMTIEEKVGQLFAFYNNHPVYSEFVEEAVRDWKVGGIFLDTHSLQDPAQVHRLTKTLQETALKQRSGIPLFISADLVAGAGCKFDNADATHFPKNKAVGACGDEELAYESGRITALEALEFGVNFNYSPVVDINNNPLNPVIGTHSFGEDADLVSRMGVAVIQGYQEHGMIATAKHFPGHGDTSVDSHFALPVLSFDRSRIEEFELVPFRRAIAAGVDAIMVGHIAVPSLDPSGLPASLSEPITTGVLRRELGFEGLIVTDGMSMKGVTAQFSQAEASVMAIQAGADILLVCPADVEEGREIVQRVLSAVRSGELDEARMDESVRRILRIKEKYGLTAADLWLKEELDLGALKRPEYEAVSLKLAQGALQDVGGFEELLQTVVSEGKQWTLYWDKQLARFASQISAVEFIVQQHRMESYESLVEVLELLESSSGQDEAALESGAQEAAASTAQAATTAVNAAPRLLFAITHNKLMSRKVLEKLNQYAAWRPGQVALIHFGSQYDLAHLPDVPSLLLFDKAPSLQTAAAEFISEMCSNEQ